MDAFAYNISTTGLPLGSPYPQPTVSVRFDHSSEPVFRGLAQAVAQLVEFPATLGDLRVVVVTESRSRPEGPAPAVIHAS